MTHHDSLFRHMSERMDKKPPSQAKPQIASNLDQASLDELEFEERHGAQYHLRHHLSGCSQTLYTIDFNKDFSVIESIEQRLPPLFRPEEQATSSTASVIVPSSFAEAYLSADIITTQQPLTSSLPMLQKITEKIEFEKSNNVHQTSSEMPLSNTTAPAPVVMHTSTEPTMNNASSPTDRYVADFEDMNLGGWTLGNNLSAEQVIEAGKLHFSDDKFYVDQPLIQQQFIFVKDSHYQFEFEVETSSGSLPLGFALMVNDIRIPMERISLDGGYLLHADFIAQGSELVNLVLMPTGPLPAQSAIWLDNLTVQPVSPISNESSHVELASERDNTVGLKLEPSAPLNLETLLSPIEHMPMLNVAQLDDNDNSVLTLEGLVDNSELNEWNMQMSTIELPFPLPPENHYSSPIEENSFFY
ncbi:MAG: hypothetical protein LBE90_18660 [Pantoea dispersa]|jgi:hypothetical protein|nr:hypothetical protein [Pantoea dispersa]MBZ6392508.1 hypothetical protein [Pantoea dispersa]